MRKFLVSLLLASVAATPVLAATTAQSNSNAAAAERRAARESRSNPRTAPRSKAQPTTSSSHETRRVSPRPADRAPVVRPLDKRTTTQRPVNRSPGAIVRKPPIEHRPEIIQRRLEKGPVVSRVPRAGTQPPPKVQARPTAPPRWNTTWRNNSRYDWRDWRQHHRSQFHLRVYIDPFGWGYNRYSIGWRLWPRYFESSYWIVDPWMYHLPPPPPGTRWVRYYNDALLVDLWSGQVIDVIYGVFW